MIARGKTTGRELTRRHAGRSRAMVGFDSSRADDRVSKSTFSKAARRWLRACLGTIALLGSLAGCKTPPAAPPPVICYTAFHSPQLAAIPLRRVVVLPMENYTQFPEASERVLNHTLSDLRAAGLFDLVALPPYEVRECRDQFALHGCYPETLLVDLAHRYRADGVLFSSMNTYDPYWPPRIGVTMHVVSAYEDVTLISVDGMWDAGEASVAMQASSFYAGSAHQYQIPRPELAVFSPEQFERFVARQILEGIAPPPAATPNGPAAPAVANTAPSPSASSSGNDSARSASRSARRRSLF